MYGFVRVRRRRTEHARDLRLIEEREEDRDALDDGGAELGVERHPVVQVPPLDRLDLLPELAPRAALALLGLERDRRVPRADSRNPGSSRQVAFSVPATGSQAQSSRGSL